MKIQLLNIVDMLKNKTFIAVFINCLLMPINVEIYTVHSINEYTPL